MNISKPEKLLGKAIRARGVKIKSQHKINNHKIDIFIEPNICVEVDGKIFHNYPFGTAKDRKENVWFEMHGYTVLRYWDDEVLKNTENIVDQIISNIRDTDFDTSFENLFNFEPIKFSPFRLN